MTHHADDLEARLRGQGGMLANLADDLQVRRPKLTPIPPEGAVDPATALARVAGGIDRADAEVRTAVERGRRPELLPRLGAGPRAEGLRATLVYGLVAVVVLVVQLLSIRHGVSSYFRVLFVIPLVGFLVGYAALSFGGRARLGRATAEGTPAKPAVKSGLRRKGKQRVQAPLGPTRPRFGFVLCFGIGPVLLVIDVLVHLAGPAGK